MADALLEALRRHFGHPGFRPGQEPLIRAVLAGRDAVGILPTGGGKSVLYLLPSALREGLTLVVSPLVSLMSDQVDRARKAGIPAAALHQGVPADERRRVLATAERGGLRVLLVAPERLENEAFRTVLERLPLRLLAVDEAHCVVHWGFDFRPSYLALAGLGQRLEVPVLAVTATATPAVRRTLENVLRLREPARHVSSFDRANLRWAVVSVRDPAERWRRLQALVRESPGPALVYAGTRRQVEALRSGLARRGVDAEAYHAGLPAMERARVQERFLGGDCRLVVATNAFGMGVDKPDVRRVVHWSAPGSLEAYYQEAGRGGRDGGTAECVILSGAGDGELHRRFLDSAHPPPRVLRRVARRLGSLDPGLDEAGRQRAVQEVVGGGAGAPEPGGLLRALERYRLVPAPEARSEMPDERRGWPATARARRRSARARLRAMDRYLRARGCRRRVLLAYFGEDAAGRCGGCDRCDARGGGDG
jgi:ATP-dependent DNA helicase RecQ